MSKTKFTLFFVAILIVAIVLQALMVVNWDAIWLAHCAKLLLSGKHYYHDFFETNPPLIIWLSMPIVWLSSWMSVPVALKSYVFLFSFLMLFVASRVSKAFFAEDSFKHYVLMLALAFAYLVLPMYSFGEREHFALMLIMPYMLLVTYRLCVGTPRGFMFCLLIGVLAGAGFSLKPYFLPAVIFVELYYLVSKRRLIVAFRTETVAILAFMVAYLFAVYFFTPFYFKNILPMVRGFYLNGYVAWPVIKLVVFWGFAFALEGMVVLFGLSFYTKEAKLYRVFILAAFGFYIGFLYQGQAWYYHYFPTFALVYLLFLYGMFNDFRFLFKSGWPIAACLGALIRITLCLGFLVWGTLFFLSCTLPGIAMKQNPRSSVNQLIQYANKHIGNKSVLVISANLSMQQVLRVRSDVKLTSRFPMMVFIPGIESYRLNGQSTKYHKLYRQVMSLYGQELKGQQPDFIIYDKTKYWVILDKLIYSVPVLPFLLRDKQFVDFFRRYKEVYDAKAFLVFELKS